MKYYFGQRMEEGCEVYVVQEGKRYPLPLFQSIRNHSPTGFEWGYDGSGPAQLALAILADHFGPDHIPNYCPYCGAPMKGPDCTEPECAYDARADQYNSIQGKVVHYQDFKRDVVSQFPELSFSITSQEIVDWVTKHAKRPVTPP